VWSVTVILHWTKSEEVHEREEDGGGEEAGGVWSVGKGRQGVIFGEIGEGGY